MAASALDMPGGHLTDNYYTLEEYASEFFRQGKKSDMSGVISIKTGKTVPDWSKTIEPITAPLLARTPDRLQTDAMLIFLSILKYSGDFPARKSDYVTELTDQIFRGPIEKPELRDELYCQINSCEIRQNLNFKLNCRFSNQNFDFAPKNDFDF